MSHQPRRATSRRLRAVVALTSVGLSVTGLSAVSASAQAAGHPSSTTIAGTKPRWLSSAKVTAAPDAAQKQAASHQAIRVYLAPRGGLAALKSAVAAVSNPTSPQYGHYLTTKQYDAKYEPTDKAVAAVTKYLRSQGISVNRTGAHNRYISASADRSALDKAFHVTLRDYVHSGQRVVAPNTAASVPASVGTAILTVSGLDTSVNAMHSDLIRSGGKSGTSMQRAKATVVTPNQLSADSRTTTNSPTPPEGTVTAKPCSVYWGQLPAKYQGDYKTKLPKYKGQVLNYASCGYTGAQLFTGVGGELSTFGQGQTVAVVDAYASGTLAKDVNTYSSTYGIAKLGKGQLTQVYPSKFANQVECGASDWTTEETLDVEAVHSMRPDANIRYYAAKDCVTGLLDSLGQVVDDNKADVVSSSWGGYEINTGLDDVMAYEQVFLQGEMQGQTFVFSSGDNGDEVADIGVKTVEYPASDPYVTSVGGTSIGLGYGIGLNKAETGWGNNVATLSTDETKWEDQGFLYGSGGGSSQLFAQPSYQKGVVPSSLSNGRAVPDVSNVADPATGMLIGQTQTFPDGVRYGEFRVGGTSLAAPLVASKIIQATQATKKRLGDINPVLYKIDSSSYYDIKPSNTKGTVVEYYNNGKDASDGYFYEVRTWNQDASLHTATGWDPVTGLGRPNGLFEQGIEIYLHTLTPPTGTDRKVTPAR